MKMPDVTRNSPLNQAAYVALVTALLALLGTLAFGASDNGLVRCSAVGALLIAGYYLYAPSTLDLTGWTIAVMAMFPLGTLMLAGPPIAYALWVAFVGPHVEVTVK